MSAASGGNSEPKQGQRSQSARGFCPRSTMRVPQPDIIEHFGNADAVPQLPERCLSRKAGIVRCCLKWWNRSTHLFGIFENTAQGVSEKSKLSSISTSTAGLCVKNPWNPQRIPAALCLTSCLCLRNIRHFLCFQIHLKYFRLYATTPCLTL